jgi:uncharacterized HAD superfamily protein
LVLTVKSVADLNAAIMANIHRLDRGQFDIVCGIPRSGMLPATILATQLQLPLATVESLTRGIVYGRSGVRMNVAPPRVLLVDDTVNHGRAMAQAVKALRGKATSILRFCVFGPYRGIEGLVDIFCETVPGPRAFEWNMQKHRRLSRWGFDMDGVLCRDPTKDENDDGRRYIEFMRSAEPMFVPRRPIGHVVTCRLEKYRNETENWLRGKGIEFGALHMMPFASKAERMAHGGRGAWKAGIVKESGAEFFIESCPKQAGIIAREAAIPVWCTRTQALAEVK